MNNKWDKCKECSDKLECHFHQKMTDYEVCMELLRRKEIFDAEHPEFTKEGSYLRQDRDEKGRFADKSNSDDSVESQNSELKEGFVKSSAKLLGISETAIKNKLRSIKNE